MEIQRKTEDGRVQLTEIPSGGTFLFMNGGEIHMKVDARGHASINYVLLSTGLTGYTRQCRVFPVKGKFVEE